MHRIPSARVSLVPIRIIFQFIGYPDMTTYLSIPSLLWTGNMIFWSCIHCQIETQNGGGKCTDALFLNDRADLGITSSSRQCRLFYYFHHFQFFWNFFYEGCLLSSSLIRAHFSALFRCRLFRTESHYRSVTPFDESWSLDSPPFFSPLGRYDKLSILCLSE